jgi:spore germination cell wall hydrolase CwlJ-like protein
LRRYGLIILPLIILTPTFSKADDKQIRCIATAIHYEARGSTLQDKIGVANVIMNRTKNPNFPKTPCAVVLQKNQFSWTNSKWSYNTNHYDIAKNVFTGKLVDNTRGSMYFHTPRVNPKWSRTKKKILIGGHYYMR